LKPDRGRHGNSSESQSPPLQMQGYFPHLGITRAAASTRRETSRILDTAIPHIRRVISHFVHHWFRRWHSREPSGNPNPSQPSFLITSGQRYLRKLTSYLLLRPKRWRTGCISEHAFTDLVRCLAKHICSADAGGSKIQKSILDSAGRYPQLRPSAG
jgi:hypothetical protein